MKVIYEDAINNWPEDDRPREKLLKKGAHTLSNAELIAVLIRTGTKGKNAIELSRAILKEVKNLRELDEIDISGLYKIKGLNSAKIANIKAALELGKRVLSEKRKKKGIIKSSKDVYEIMLPFLRDKKREVFKAIFLNAQNNIIEISTISEGSVTSSVVYTREIINLANRYGAASMIFVHNHPSGDPKPSKEDKNLTEDLVLGGRIMGIRVLDHIIIGDNIYFSFSDEGLIEFYSRKRIR
jgi:DNA repair protein RadC